MSLSDWKDWFEHWLSPDEKLIFETAHFTAQGGRANQEDVAAFRRWACGGVWALADGVGGQGAGEVAAALAVECVLQGANETTAADLSALERLLVQAHQTVRDGRLVSEDQASMACTLVVLAADGKHALWGHVGDSRLYHIRQGRIMHRTEDHSLYQLLQARGALDDDQTLSHVQRNVILQALGQSNLPEFRLSKPLRLRAGDAFLLCSDGLWGLVDDDELLDGCDEATSAQAWLDRILAMSLPRMTENADNLTVLAVKVVKAQTS